MDLGKLIDSLMRAALEHAGAQRGLLILQRGDQLLIEAEATTGDHDVTVRQQGASVSAAVLPESVVRYVMRTRHDAILDDASSGNEFSADPYILQNRVRSILSLPLITQAKLTGVLYLENNLAARVFTPDRITVLRVLVSQAAISLENARLYRDLEDREAKIRRLVDANILGIFTWNLEGAIVGANDAFLRMLQYDREDLVSGRVRWVDLTPVEWGEHDERALAAISATGTVQPYEKEYFRKDGSRLPVLVAAALLEEGGRDGVAFALDLSEQKGAEGALRRSESHLAQAQQLAHIGSWAWETPRRNGLYASEEWYRIRGLDPKDGIPAWEERLQRIHPEDRLRYLAAIEQAITDKAGYDVEFRVLLPSLEDRHIHSVGHPILSSSGELLHFVGVEMDVTESKQAEEERERLRRVQADLAHVTRVSTMGELTASLAHEIRQPIGAAVTNAEACLRFIERQEPDLQGAREAAHELVKDARRAADIIERVRSLYQKGPSQLETIDVNQVIGEMATMMGVEANRHAVTIRTDLAERLPSVMADRAQLQQALMNLLLNGIEAMEGVGGELKIGSQLAPDGQLLILVSDVGVGLPTDKLSEIFNAFVTTKARGTGLGLAITRSIVQSHGGHIWATANSGGGATFQFTLPIKEGARA
jgi:PAS domain S-box-containing protein